MISANSIPGMKKAISIKYGLRSVHIFLAQSHTFFAQNFLKNFWYFVTIIKKINAHRAAPMSIARPPKNGESILSKNDRSANIEKALTKINDALIRRE